MPYRCDKCGRPQFGCYDAKGRHYLGKYTTDDGPEVSHWVRCDDGSVMLPNGDMVDAVGEFGCFDDELLLTEADLDGTVLMRAVDGSVVLRQPHPWWPVALLVGIVILFLAGIALLSGDEEAHAACRQTHSDAVCVQALR